MTSSNTRPIVWLASYPKSGNTWLRAIVDAAAQPGQFTLDDISPGGQPHVLVRSFAALGLEARWFGELEAEQIREGMLLSAPDRDHARIDLRKTHDVYRARPESWSAVAGGAPSPFPVDVTSAAIHLVRDPRDVAPSLAAYMNSSLESAVAFMGEHQGWGATPGSVVSEQIWGSWSGHCESWMAADVPFPVHRVRYEDLRSDPVPVAFELMRAVGYDVDESDVARAVEQTAFERLREQEQTLQFGFIRALPPQTLTFFRKGEAGSWREDLPVHLADAIVATHGAMMARLGYET